MEEDLNKKIANLEKRVKRSEFKDYKRWKVVVYADSREKADHYVRALDVVGYESDLPYVRKTTYLKSMRDLMGTDGYLWLLEEGLLEA
jgi:hypothetical protein